MSIVESDGPPSWSLDVSETGESTKCLWVGVILSPVSLASRDQDGGPSDSTIDIYDLTEKQGTVNSLGHIRSSKYML